MPLFEVIKQTPDDKAEYFAFDEPGTPIGSPSAFGIVYEGYRADRYGSRLDGEQWVVKVSNSADHRQRFEEEYDVLVGIVEGTKRNVNEIHSPNPVYLLRRKDDNRPAIAMPRYTKHVRDLIKGWNEIQIVEQLYRYVAVIQALNGLGYICTDRKPDDLFWEKNELVVIDWNVLRPFSDAQYRQAEISLIGRIWYVLLTGYEPGLSLNPYVDKEWKYFSDSDSQSIGQISMGLRLILSDILTGNRYKNVNDILSTLKMWSGWLNDNNLSLNSKILTKRLQIDLGLLSDKKAQLILADLVWRTQRDAGARSMRGELQDQILQQSDDLEDIQGRLDEIARAVKSSSIDEAQRLLGGLPTLNDAQTVALKRWELLIHSLNSPELDFRLRGDLLRNCGSLSDGIRRLQISLDADSDDALIARTRDLPTLQGVESTFDKVLVPLAHDTNAYKNLIILQYEADMRMLLNVRQGNETEQKQNYVDRLLTIDRLRSNIPYASDLLKALNPHLEIEIKVAKRKQEANHQIEAAVNQVDEAVKKLVAAWKPLETQPDLMRQVSTAFRRSEADVFELGRDAVNDFENRVIPQRALIGKLPFLNQKSYELKEASETINQIRKFFENSVDQSILNKLDNLLGVKIDEALAKLKVEVESGDINFVHLRVMRNQVDALKSYETRLNNSQRSDFVDLKSRVDEFEKFVDRLSEPSAKSTDVLRAAKDRKISLNNAILAPHLERVIKDSVDLAPDLKQEIEDDRKKLKQDMSAQQKNYELQTNRVNEIIATVDQKIDSKVTAQGNQFASKQGFRLSTILLAVLALIGLVLGILGIVSNSQTQTALQQQQELNTQQAIVAATSDSLTAVAVVSTSTAQAVSMQATIDSLVAAQSQNQQDNAAATTAADQANIQATQTAAVEAAQSAVPNITDGAAVTNPNPNGEATQPVDAATTVAVAANLTTDQTAETSADASAEPQALGETATVEATEATMEASAEVTPDATDELTPEASAEATIETPPTPVAPAQEPLHVDVLALSKIQLTQKEQEDVLKTLKNTSTLDFVLRYKVVNGEAQGVFPLEPNSDFYSHIVNTINPALDNFNTLGVKTEFWMVIRDGKWAVPLIFITADSKNVVLVADKPPVDLLKGTLITFDDNSKMRILRPLPEVGINKSNIVITILTPEQINALNAVLGIRGQLVKLPQADALVAMQVDGNGLLGLMAETPVSFLRWQAVAVPNSDNTACGGNIRNEAGSTDAKTVITKILCNTIAQLQSPNQLTAIDPRLDNVELVALNRVSILFTAADNTKFYWYSVAITPPVNDHPFGWVSETIVVIKAIGQEPGLPTVITLPFVNLTGS